MGGVCRREISSTDSNWMSGATRTLERKMSLICLTKASEWLVANAHRYGFVVRFDGAHEEWTGYKAEPWHLRYVGVEVATAVHEAGGLSLEEFFGLEPPPDYAD